MIAPSEAMAGAEGARSGARAARALVSSPLANDDMGGGFSFADDDAYDGGDALLTARREAAEAEFKRLRTEKRKAKQRSEKAERAEIRVSLRAQIAAGALVTNTNYLSPPSTSTEKIADIRAVPGFSIPKGGRRLDYWMRDELRPYAVERGAKCGNTWVGVWGPGATQTEGVGAEVWIVSASPTSKGGAVGRAHYRGLMRCGSAWSCPVCSSMKRRAYAARLQQRVVRWEQAHGVGSVFLVTATYSHALGDDLKVARDGMAEAWSSMQTGAPWKRLKLRFGVRAIGKSPDTTYGKAGWHSHIHALVFFDHPLTEDERAELERVLGPRWANKVVAQLGESHRPSVEHGIVVTEAHKADYQMKLGFRPDTRGLELTDAAHAKKGKRGSRTPLQIAYDLAVYKRPEDALLWMDYCDAMKGARMMSWSGDIDVAEPTMEEAAEELGESKAVKLMDIDTETWERVRDIRGAKVTILEAAEIGGEAAVRALLARMLSLDAERDGAYAS